MVIKERKHTTLPRYDEAFKAGVVRMVTEQGRPSREVATELGYALTRCAASSRQQERRRSGRRIVRTAIWRRKTVHCAKSLRRKTRSLTY